jgi:hypothetical protein
VMAWLSAYPYLAWSLVLMAAVGAGFAVCPARQRRPMLLSGLLAAPLALVSSSAFVPDYWKPVCIAQFLASPEDILFSFASGGIVWLMAAGFLRTRMAVDVRPKRLVRRYLLCTVLGLVLSLGCVLSGARPMTAAIVVGLGLGVALLWRRSDLWPMAMAGLVGFGAFYSAWLCGVSFATPWFCDQWNAEGLWGPRLRGIPLEEYVWGAGFGAVWPVFAAYLFDARLTRPSPAAARATFE